MRPFGELRALQGVRQRADRLAARIVVELLAAADEQPLDAVDDVGRFHLHAGPRMVRSSKWFRSCPQARRLRSWDDSRSISDTLTPA